jgi:hypothetical protein
MNATLDQMRLPLSFGRNADGFPTEPAPLHMETLQQVVGDAPVLVYGAQYGAVLLAFKNATVVSVNPPHELKVACEVMGFDLVPKAPKEPFPFVYFGHERGFDLLKEARKWTGSTILLYNATNRLGYYRANCLLARKLELATSREFMLFNERGPGFSQRGLLISHPPATASQEETPEVEEPPVEQAEEEPPAEAPPAKKASKKTTAKKLAAKRARKASGKFKPDDPATPDVNEAWKGGKKPEQKDEA